MQSDPRMQYGEHECPDCGGTIVSASLSLPSRDNELTSMAATVHADELGGDIPELVLRDLILNGIGEPLQQAIENND